jgi:hypothetical protein
MSMGYVSLTDLKELGAVLHPGQDHSAPTRSDAHAKARTEDPARAFIKHVGFLTVYAVFQRFCDGHFDHFIRIFLEAFTRGWVAHHPLWTLTAIDFANARQSHSTAAGNFAGNQLTDRV